MINQKQLCEFLVKAKMAGYASGNKAEKTREKNKSKTIVFQDGNWKYYDNYFGGEPYGGEEIMFFKNKPIYIMVYYGSVDKSISDFKKIYKFLQEALALIPKNKPFRGPKFYKNGNYAYRNWFHGEITNFFGVEKIYFGKKKIYEAKYVGGLVDQRKEKNG
jgi:hypothetical protein